MKPELIEFAREESLEDVIKTLKELIAWTEDKIKHIVEGKTAEI